MTANLFFTYVSGKRPDGTAYAHRTNQQLWTIPHGNRTLSIYVQGPLPDGHHNAFAKKHLMTTAAGDSPKAKLTSVSSRRRNDAIAATNQARRDEYDELLQYAPAHAAEFNAANAYGMKAIGFNTPLTMVHCNADGMTPHKLKTAFADAIAAIGSGAWESQGAHQVARTNVRFKDKIIYNQLYNKNDITVTNRMCVMVMKDRALHTYHVFHGEPYDASQANAGP